MISAQDIADLLELPLQGEPKRQFLSFKNLVDAGVDDISYAEAKFKTVLVNSKVGIVLTTPALAEYAPGLVIVTDQPREDFARLLRHYFPTPKPKPGLHTSVVIEPSSQVASDVTIGPFCVVGPNVKIESGAVIGSHVTLHEGVVIGKDTHVDDHVVLHANTQVGQNCHLSSGCVIGAAGFGYVASSQGWQVFPQIAGVVIGNRVDIGANTTIDRGALKATSIGDGVKIDNQVQLGHGVQIGQNTIISGCAAVGGSTQIGENCMIGGASCISDNVTIVSGTFLAGATTVARSIKKPGLYASYHDATPFQEWQRKQIRINKLNNWLKDHSLKELSE